MPPVNQLILPQILGILFVMRKRVVAALHAIKE